MDCLLKKNSLVTINQMTELNDLRAEIDSIDCSLLSLLDKRREIVCDIFEQKKILGLSLQDHTREKEIIDMLSAKTKRFSKSEIADIWSAIITSSYKLLP